MLKRLYLDNFKCFVNFEWRPSRSTLLTGLNGTGKSALFDLLEQLRGFASGEVAPQEAFPTRTLTRWQTSPVQTVELDVERASETGPETIRYRLEIEQDPEHRRCRILREEVEGSRSDTSGPLFLFQDGQVRLFGDDHTPGQEFPFDWKGSGLTTVGERPGHTRLHWFKRWLRDLYTVRVNPWSMSALSESEVEHPKGDLRDFASWYRHVLLQKPVEIHGLFRSLGEIVDGFRGLELVPDGGETKILKVRAASPISGTGGKDLRLDFDELSDGQRVLIALHALLHLVRDHATLVCLDEPENFLALAEIQPLISEFCDRAEEGDLQVVFASHHPELIDHPGIETRLLLRRDAGGPVRVGDLAEAACPGLTLAETIACGWENHG